MDGIGCDTASSMVTCSMHHEHNTS